MLSRKCEMWTIHTPVCSLDVSYWLQHYETTPNINQYITDLTRSLVTLSCRRSQKLTWNVSPSYSSLSARPPWRNTNRNYSMIRVSTVRRLTAARRSVSLAWSSTRSWCCRQWKISNHSLQSFQRTRRHRRSECCHHCFIVYFSYLSCQCQWLTLCSS